MHEFLISYGHAAWYLLFLQGETVLAVAEASSVNN